MSLLHIAAVSDLEPQEDQIRITKDGQVLAMNARMTPDMIRKKAIADIRPLAAALQWLLRRKNLYTEALAEAERTIRHMDDGHWRASVQVMLEVEDESTVKAQVRRVGTDGTVSYREIEHQSRMVRP